MLGPVVDDVDQHLPNGHPLVHVFDVTVRQGGQPGIDRDLLGLPALPQLVDRRERFEFRLRSVVRALRLESDAPALGGTEVVDEDASQASLADVVRPRPHCWIQAIEDGQHLFGRPAVIREQKPDIGGLHM